MVSDYRFCISVYAGWLNIRSRKVGIAIRTYPSGDSKEGHLRGWLGMGTNACGNGCGRGQIFAGTVGMGTAHVGTVVNVGPRAAVCCVLNHTGMSFC